MQPDHSRNDLRGGDPFDPFSSAVCPSADLARKIPGYEGVQRMDLTPVEPEDRFRIDGDYARIMGEKDRLIAADRHLVYRVTPDAIHGSREILEEAIPALCTRYPETFSRYGNSIRIASLNRVIPLDQQDPDPLLTLSLLVQEDITLLHRDSMGMYRLAAGCVCFPSHWSLKDKIGKSVAEIHAPVPELNARIGAKIDTLLDRLSADRPLERINFLINFNPRLSQFPEIEVGSPHVRPEQLTEENIGEVLWLRNERETLSKLSRSDDVIFTFKTYQTQLRAVPPATAKKLADMHRELPDRYRAEYRKLTLEEHNLLIDYLEFRGRQPE